MCVCVMWRISWQTTKMRTEEERQESEGKRKEMGTDVGKNTKIEFGLGFVWMI